MLTSSTQKNTSSKVAIVLAYLALVSSMLVAMLSALHGVFCAREKLLVPYEVCTTYICYDQLCLCLNLAAEDHGTL